MNQLTGKENKMEKTTYVFRRTIQEQENEYIRLESVLAYIQKDSFLSYKEKSLACKGICDQQSFLRNEIRFQKENS